MKLLQLIRDDTQGAVLLETTLTFPIFLLVIFGLIQFGVMTFAQIRIQHAVEMTARCLSVSTDTIVTTNRCSTTTLQNFEKGNAPGFQPANLTFTVVKNAMCGTICGNRVSVSYPYQLIPGNLSLYIFKWTLKAQSCYPTTPPTGTTCSG